MSKSSCACCIAHGMHIRGIPIGTTEGFEFSWTSDEQCLEAGAECMHRAEPSSVATYRVGAVRVGDDAAAREVALAPWHGSGFRACTASPSPSFTTSITIPPPPFVLL